ncbi:response regulator [Paenirhodobacter sp.]|uniref:response regulator n=1 Tax=Paenirhodobacter sp. TaxID=1965326 RepID=UPI003B510369
MPFPIALRRYSLATTLIAVILIALVPTLVILALTLMKAGQSQREISTRQLMESAHIVARSTVSEMSMLQRLLRVSSGSGGFGTNELAAVAERIGGTHAIYHVRRNGDILDPPAAGLDPDLAAAVAGAMRNGEARLTNFLQPPGGGTPSMVSLVLPIARSPEADRVAVITARSSRLFGALARESKADGGVMMAITDGKGRIINRSVDGEAVIGRMVPDWDVLTALNADAGSFRARTLEGQEIVFAFQRIEHTPGWMAVAGEPAETFDARWQEPLHAMIGAAAVTITAALALAIMLVGRVLRPIKALAERSARIASDVDGVARYAAMPPTLIAEFDTLRVALDGAEAALRRSLAESRQAEAALRENYAMLMQAERLARIGSWTFDPQSGDFTSSPTLREMNGHPDDQPLRMEDLRDMVDEETFRRIEAAIECCARSGTPYGMELLHLRRDGRHFPAWLQGQAIRDENGRVTRIIGIVQDISERREQAELLFLLADNLPSGLILRLERRGGRLPVVAYISAGVERLIGLAPEQIIAEPERLARAIHPADRRAVYRALLRPHRVGDVIDLECRLTGRDGGILWVHTRAALRRATGNRMVWDGISIDITVEREAALALQSAKEAAEAAERAKSDFLATMSHELRTPMNTLIGMSRLAQHTVSPAKQRDYLRKINTSANVLLDLINDILDFSKIEAGRLLLENKVFRLEQMLDTVSSVNALRAEEKGLELAFSVAPDTPQVVRGDPLRLGQVLTNLVGNAIKFTETGDVVVLVRPVPAGHGVRLLFEVRDTGIGLSKEQIPGLFRPFVQGGADIPRRYGGTGLGLAISRQLVTMMGGEIWVESTPGEGSRFFFTVALEPVAEEEAPPGPALPTGQLRGRRALIVDDNASARMALSEMLEGFGMSVRAASDAPTALRLLAQEALAGGGFDVMLVDLRMPGMDGMELIRRLSSTLTLPKLPAVLMITAYGPAGLAEQPGVDAVLHKPVTPSVMFNTLNGVLSAVPRPRAAPVPARDMATLLSGRRVLVADDNALNREVASDFLELAGAEVVTAVNGRDAIEKLQGGQFDAVLMDVHMPVMSGLEAAREIRRNPGWEGLPVIALTAQARAEDQAQSLAAGMTGHLTKPIDEAALYRALLLAMGHGPEAAHAPAIDIASLRQRFGATPRLQRFVNGFLRDFGAMDREAAGFLEAGDIAGLAELAHRVKGTAGYFGAARLVEQAQQLEAAGRARELEAVRALLPGFCAEAASCLAALRSVQLQLVEGAGGALPASEARVLVDRAVPLVSRGEYAAFALLERLVAGLSGDAAAIAREALADFEATEIAATEAALARLRDSLA